MATAPRLTPDREFDAVVVGAGPNGLVAAATLGAAGWRVLVLEAAPVAGGGSRSEALTLPGFVHDVCSAIHPLALASPGMRALPLADQGLEWIHPDAPLAHPLDGGRVAFLERDVDATAAGFGRDARSYRRLFAPFVRSGDALIESLMSPLDVPPRHPLVLARYGAVGIRPATWVGRRFETDEAAALFSGLAAHSILSLRAPSTAGFGMFLGVLAHHVGWPMAKGGSAAIGAALTKIIVSQGGTIECDHAVTSLRDLPPARATLLDLTPRQVLGARRRPAARPLPPHARTLPLRAGRVQGRLGARRPHAVDQPRRARAATVHLGGTAGEIVAAESDVQRGRHPERPFTLFAQPSLFDPSRARRASTPPGRTATCPTARPST